MVRIAYAKTQEAMTAMQVKSRDKQVSEEVHYTRTYCFYVIFTHVIVI